MKQKIILFWSGGKDSALAFYELLQQGNYEITLLTTISEKYGRISAHGVREALLEKQVESLGCDLEKVYLNPNCTNEEYELKMAEAINRYKKLGVTKMAFGDLFLEEVRNYREQSLEKLRMEALFPLWGRATGEVAAAFIKLGFKAIITCVDTQVLPGEFTGRFFDPQFLTDLPGQIDPCGENGEFHSFVFDGPIFKERISFSVGEKILRDGRFNFCDLR